MFAQYLDRIDPLIGSYDVEKMDSPTEEERKSFFVVDEVFDATENDRFLSESKVIDKYGIYDSILTEQEKRKFYEVGPEKIYDLIERGLYKLRNYLDKHGIDWRGGKTKEYCLWGYAIFITQSIIEDHDYRHFVIEKAKRLQHEKYHRIQIPNELFCKFMKTASDRNLYSKANFLSKTLGKNMKRVGL